MLVSWSWRKKEQVDLSNSHNTCAIIVLNTMCSTLIRYLYFQDTLVDMHVTGLLNQYTVGRNRSVQDNASQIIQAGFCVKV